MSTRPHLSLPARGDLHFPGTFTNVPEWFLRRYDVVSSHLPSTVCILKEELAEHSDQKEISEISCVGRGGRRRHGIGGVSVNPLRGHQPAASASPAL